MTSSRMQDALEALKAAKACGEPGWVDAFHAALDRVLALDDPASVEGLLLLLDDHHKYQEVLWSIMHGAEHFPVAPYIAGLVRAMPTLATQAPDWASLLTGRVLNSPTCRQALAAALATSPPATRAEFGVVLRQLKRDNPAQFGVSVDELAAAMDKNRSGVKPNVSDRSRL